MRRFLVAFPLLALVLAACGATGAAGPEHGSFLKPRLAFWSPVLVGHTIPANYSCRPGVWLPLRWGRPPSGTGELVLVAGSYGDPEASTKRVVSRVNAGEGVIQLSPRLRRLAPGAPPHGALTISVNRAPVCPSRASGEEFVFRLFALPATHEVTEESLGGKSPSVLLEAVQRNALAVGEFVAAYKSAM